MFALRVLSFLFDASLGLGTSFGSKNSYELIMTITNMFDVVNERLND